MKRLIKKAKEYSFFNDKYEHSNEDFITIYKNPSNNEIEKTRKIDGDIRGLIYRNGDVYIWNGGYIHAAVSYNISNDAPQIDFNEFHFFTDGKDYIRIHNDETIIKDTELRPAVKSAYSTLCQIVNSNAELEIMNYDSNTDYTIRLQDYYNDKDIEENKIANKK